MKKITFTNEVNGLSAAFATDTPMMFLEDFDGCSCGSQAITYRPLEYNGQRFVSSSLTARTVQFTVNFGGRTGGRYSRTEALKRWDEIQRVFVPGDIGTLTWTNGTDSRFIKCRAETTPKPTQIMPYLFRAAFSLTADSPFWLDSSENTVTLAQGQTTITINNPCGIAVPFVVNVGTTVSVFAMASVAADAGMAFESVGEAFTINTADCTVISASGKLCNNLLSVDSEFFNIMPGINKINLTGNPGVTFRWRKAYMGIY